MITIHVTRDDLKKGNYEQTDDCPICRALKRQVSMNVRVGYDNVTIDDTNYILKESDNLKARFRSKSHGKWYHRMLGGFKVELRPAIPWR